MPQASYWVHGNGTGEDGLVITLAKMNLELLAKCAWFRDVLPVKPCLPVMSCSVCSSLRVGVNCSILPVPLEMPENVLATHGHALSSLCPEDAVCIVFTVVDTF